MVTIIIAIVSASWMQSSNEMSRFQTGSAMEDYSPPKVIPALTTIFDFGIADRSSYSISAPVGGITWFSSSNGVSFSKLAF